MISPGEPAWRNAYCQVPTCYMTGTKRDSLLNHDVIAVDQAPLGAQGHRVARTGKQEIWVKPMADGGRTLLLWNRGEAPARIVADWTKLGLPTSVKLHGRDLWTHKDLGRLSNGYHAEVPPHGVVMIRLFG